MTVRLRALQTFARLGGRVRKGTEFTTSEDRAAYLTASGLAERLDHPSTARVAGPKRVEPQPQPSEVNDEITAVGGGWFEWRGKRYRGKAAAEAAKEQEG
ncbi:MAG TPA: hypothetical protein VF164_11775 [Trueperaceae bacterium]